jgi:hypothetical protein
MSGRDLRDVAEQAERRWASKARALPARLRVRSRVGYPALTTLPCFRHQAPKAFKGARPAGRLRVRGCAPAPSAAHAARIEGLLPCMETGGRPRSRRVGCPKRDGCRAPQIIRGEVPKGQLPSLDEYRAALARRAAERQLPSPGPVGV